VLLEVRVHACTDITGFGLIGHTVQLAQNSRVGINIDIASIPFFPKTGELAMRGLYSGGLHRNREFYSPYANIASEVPTHIQDILFDPQTSGGLLICLAPGKSARMLNRLHQAGVAEAVVIGEAVSQPRGLVTAK